MENETIFEKQANEIDTGEEGNSELGTSETATISSINDDFSLENLSEDELSVVHKDIFVQIFNSSLHFTADLLADKGKSSDKEKLKSLTRKILEEKIDIMRKKLT